MLSSFIKKGIRARARYGMSVPILVTYPGNEDKRWLATTNLGHMSVRALTDHRRCIKSSSAEKYSPH